MVEHWATKYKIAGSNPRLAPIRPKLNGNLPDNLPDWASPGNWLSLEGHADLKNPVDDPSFYNLCSFISEMIRDRAIVSMECRQELVCYLLNGDLEWLSKIFSDMQHRAISL